VRPTPGRRPAPPGRATLVALAVLALGLLGGCRVGVSVEVETGADGGGHVRATVTLDDEAARQVPDLAEQLRVDDLEAAGWEVDGPTPLAGGGATVSATKPFATSEGASRALRELGGGFGTLRLRVDRSFWKTTSTLEGAVDLTGGLAAFGDEELAAVVGNPTLGLDPAAVERDLGRPLAEVLAVELVGDLRGRLDADAPGTRGGDAVWPVPLGTTVAVRATAEQWNTLSLALGAVAALSGVALLVVILRRSPRVSWG
jgi:hypothetical protein